jgi:hypothetical protein
MGSTWTPTPPLPDATGEALALLCGSYDPQSRLELHEAISRHSTALDARAIAVKFESRLRGSLLGTNGKNRTLSHEVKSGEYAQVGTGKVEIISIVGILNRSLRAGEIRRQATS